MLKPPRGGTWPGPGGVRVRRFGAREGTSPLSMAAGMWQQEAEGGDILKEESRKDASQGYRFTLQLQAVPSSKGGTDLSQRSAGTPKWIKGLILILWPLLSESSVPELISSWSIQSIVH